LEGIQGERKKDAEKIVSMATIEFQMGGKKGVAELALSLRNTA
jgi:hypothetical protein